MTGLPILNVVSNVSAPRRFYIKEWLKDQKNTYRFSARMNACDYGFIHPVKCGGTFLKMVLGEHFNLFCWDHEAKLIHFGAQHKLFFACRDPIARFESAFYSPLHRDDKISPKRLEFYKRYLTVNHYVRALSDDPVPTIRYAYLQNDLVGRFSRYSYWLGRQSTIRKHHHKIKFVFRAESLNQDIDCFFHSQGIASPDLSRQSRYAKPGLRFEPLDQQSRNFLSGFLGKEYELINCLLYSKGLPLYQIPQT